MVGDRARPPSTLAFGAFFQISGHRRHGTRSTLVGVLQEDVASKLTDNDLALVFSHIDADQCKDAETVATAGRSPVRVYCSKCRWGDQCDACQDIGCVNCDPGSIYCECCDTDFAQSVMTRRHS